MIILGWHKLNHNSEMLLNWIKVSWHIFTQICLHSEWDVTLMNAWTALEEQNHNRVIPIIPLNEFLSMNTSHFSKTLKILIGAVLGGYSMDPWFVSEFKTLPRDYIEIPILETKLCQIFHPSILQNYFLYIFLRMILLNGKWILLLYISNIYMWSCYYI